MEETPETQVSVPEVTNERPKRKASCKRKSSFAAPDSSPPGSSSSNNNSRRLVILALRFMSVRNGPWRLCGREKDDVSGSLCEI
ncbi:hypothetical protein C0J50_22532 [Silurus asotus]|uniref:Uncharacterized protein n=1 Tax=Silurus asotus TaxID=30991 RepID=A0AAD5AJV3_SILAS|nr:hypothetical protein C0J50_22532 [Silurus asotus]